MADRTTSSPDALDLPISYRGTVHHMSLPTSATIADLAEEIARTLSVPINNQKLMVSRLGLLKPPFKDATLPVGELADKKISLLGSTVGEVSAVNQAAAEASKRSARAAGAAKKTTAYRRHDWAREQDEATYTFTTLRPLTHLAHPERSLALLQRLRDDAGIKAAMRKHRWTVPLLTEMDPAEHTQRGHDGTSRTLGLNRNGGEVIELRLRTDAADGYRDYRTIRKTLCHELAHNVHGPHDADFWALCRQVEKEVAAGDWRSGGRAVSSEVFYGGGAGSGDDADDAGDAVDDHGGWLGGEFVLGGGADDADRGLSRREVLARAAEERIRRAREQHGPGGAS